MADESIDKLQIEVTADSRAAASSINTLSRSLTRLEKSIGSSGAKLLGVSRAVRELRVASANVNLTQLGRLSTLKVSSTLAPNIVSLAQSLRMLPEDAGSRLGALTALSSLNGVKVSATLGKNLAAIGVASRQLPMDAPARIRELAQALAPLNGLKVSATVGKNLGSLGQAMKSWSTLDMDRFVEQMARMNTQLPTLATNLERIAAAYRKLPESFRGAARAARSAGQANDQLAAANERAAKSADDLNAAQGRGVGLMSRFGFGMAAVTAATYAFKRGFDATVGQVNTYIENMNLFTASMGEYAREASDFGNKVQDLMGIDFADWSRNQGVFMTLATGMGETADRAAVMSQNLTQLGYDIASFYNIDVNDAMLKIQSGLAGELEPLRRLGWDLSNARMQLEATKLGIEGNVATMTQAEKVGLRYHLIMTQVTQTHGDMARTIMTPANQLRVLRAQLALTARAIGTLFIPALNAILPVVIAVVKAIRFLAENIASLFGIKLDLDIDYSGLDTSGIATGNDAIEDTSDALDDAGAAADKAKKKLQEYKNTVMGFDELNKLNDVPEDTDDGLGGAGGAGGLGDLGGAGGGFDFPLDTYDFLKDLKQSLNALTDEMARKILDALGRIAPIVAGIGAGIATWKLAPKLMRGIEQMRMLLAELRGAKFGAGFKAVEQVFDASKLSKAAQVLEGSKLLGAGAAGALPRATRVAGLLEAGNVAKNMPKASTIAGVRNLLTALQKPLAAIQGVLRTVGAYVDGILSKVAKVAPEGSKIFGVASKAAGAFALLTSNVATTVFRVVDLVIHSERFRKGIAACFDIAGKLADAIGTAASAIGGLASGIGDALSGIPGVNEAFNTMDGLVKALDLDASDAILTIGGIALIGTPIGQFMLLLEGVTLAIRALGYATSDCVEHMDPLAGVSDRTREAFGSALDSVETLRQGIDKLDWSNAAPSEEDVANAETASADIRDTILKNLDSRKNQELAGIDMLAGAKGITDERLEQMRQAVGEKYADIEERTQGGAARINEIYAAAAEEHRGLTDTEAQEVRAIQEQLKTDLIDTAGATRDELALINGAMANNDTEAALKAAEATISAAKDEHNQRVGEAQTMYDGIVATAQRMYEAGEITKSEYQAMVDAAAKNRDEQIAKADEAYAGVVESTRTGLGDAADEFDFETGSIKEKWQVWLDGLGKSFDEWNIGTAHALRDAIRDLGAQIDGFKTDVINRVNELGRGIENWWNTNIQPTLDAVGRGFETAGDTIGRALSDPIGTIQNAWSGLSDWFYTNVVRPIENLFSGISFDLPDLKLPHIIVGGYIDVPVLGMIPDPNQLWVDWYAKGGFPTEGQLFMAREAGPELVGTMGGKTTVANNDQIVEGIEAGVTRAMLQVLPALTQQSGAERVEIPLYIGSREIARAVWEGEQSLLRNGEISPMFR